MNITEKQVFGFGKTTSPSMTNPRKQTWIDKGLEDNNTIETYKKKEARKVYLYT